MAITGEITINNILALSLSADPSTAGGITAPLGSFGSVTDGSGFFIKTGAADIAWGKIAGKTGTMASTYVAYWNDANQITGSNIFVWDSAANSSLGFHGVGTANQTEIATDVNNLNPTTYTYTSNFSFDQNALTTYKFGNINTGSSAASRILVGRANRASIISIDSFPASYTVGDVPPGTAVIGGGSGFNRFMIYNDGGGLGSPNSLGNIEMSTINTISTGLTGFVISGVYATQDYIGMGTETPAVDCHIKKSVNSSTNLRVENTSNGTGAHPTMHVMNNSGNIMRMSLPGSGYTTNGAFIGNYGNFYCNGTGINFVSDNASGTMNWYVGGFAAGNLNLALSTTSLTFSSGINIATNTGTGTKIGTATSQKIGFWNATAIVQPTTAIAASTFVANTSLIANDSATWDGYTIGQVVKALRNIGLLA